MRTQGSNYIIYEVRRFRRPFTYTNTTTVDLTQLTGSMTNRFKHIDTFAISPEVGVTCKVTLTIRDLDLTGLKYPHTWDLTNANMAAPAELGINSFTQEDVVRLVITYTAGAGTATTIWFSGEEYSLVEYPTQGDTVENLPEHFIIVHPYGFSRLVTSSEFVKAGMAGRLDVGTWRGEDMASPKSEPDTE